jgi:uncharacterized membrane protein SpoIIM required for sporulation
MRTVNQMDLDALSAARREEWARLDELSRTRRLSGSEVDEFVTRYRAASADLADIKTSAGRTAQGDHVSTMLARARLRLTGAPENVARQIPRFFALQLPAALYRVRWTTSVIAVVFIVVVAVVAFWISGDPALVASLGSRAQLEYYAENQFTDYYSENPAAVFAGTVWTNNAWIAAQCVAFGVTGLWVPYVLYMNAQGVGMAGGMMAAYDQLDTFFLYILPHGLMEMTAIFIAGAAGLRIFWSWVSPGRMTRAASLAQEGRSLITVAPGLVLVLFISGLVEGFVTPSDLPHWARIGIGALVLAAYWTYTLVLGRRAYNAGERGDLGRFDAGEVARTS